MDNKVIVFLMIVFLISIFYGNMGFLSSGNSETYSVFLKVGENASFNSEQNKLFFEIPAGKVLQGSISIQNNNPKSREMNVFLKGQLKELNLVEIIEPKFILKAGEIKNIGIKISAPLKKGEYAGEILIEGRRI